MRLDANRRSAAASALVSERISLASRFFDDLFSRQPIPAVTYTLKVTSAVNSSATKRTIMPSTRDLVSDFIAKDSVVIFSKTSCPYCKMAKKVFDSLKKPYTAIELDDRDDAQEIQDVLNEITGARTVPRVFLNGVCLGGGTDVKKLYDSGELEKKF